MIKIFGMNEKVGIRVFDGDKNTEDLSPQTQELLDQEIKKQLNDSYERAKSIIKTHSNELKLIADALLKHETLDVDQIKKIIDQKSLN
jgi:ATP-dependent metalloprotease